MAISATSARRTAVLVASRAGRRARSPGLRRLFGQRHRAQQRLAGAGRQRGARARCRWPFSSASRSVLEREAAVRPGAPDRPSPRASRCSPPQVFTSTTPGTRAQQRRDLAAGPARAARRGCGAASSRVKWKISPRPPVIGPELGRARRRAGRSTARREPLLDHLPGAVGLDVVLEDGRHRRDAVARQAALLDEPGQAAERHLDGAGDEPLDLLGREPRGAGEDQHLVVGDVGQRVELEEDADQRAHDHEGERGADDQHPVADRPADECLDQGATSASAASAATSSSVATPMTSASAPEVAKTSTGTFSALPLRRTTT